MNNNKIQYNPDIFNVTNIDAAKKIILTPEAGMETDERWEKETAYLAEDIGNYFHTLTPDSIVVDYGCGIGRISKKIIEKFNCKVIGVDISKSMREMAQTYVSNSNFEVLSPFDFRQRILDGLRVDAIISIWVLQHSIDPIADVALLKASLKSNGLVYILNNKISAVPTNKGWMNNGISIFNLIQAHFTLISSNQLPDKVAKDKLKTETFIAKMIHSKRQILPKEYSNSLDTAMNLYTKKEFAQAIQQYEKAASKFPIYSNAFNGLAVSLKANGVNLNKVIDIYIRAVKLDPLNGIIYSNLSNAFRDNNQLKEAINAAYDAIRTNKNNPEFYNSLGMLYGKIKKYKEAITCYNTAIKIKPDFSKAMNNLGVLLYHLKQYEKSVSAFEECLRVDPEYTEVYSNLGASLNKAKQYSKAIIALEKAIKYNPKHGGAYTNLGNVYNKTYEYKKAAQMHEKSIELDPLGYNAYSNLGTSCKNLGQLKKAINNYKKAIELKPDFENAHFDLATIYLSQRNFKDGFEEYEWRFKKDEMAAHIIKHKNIFDAPKFDGTQDIKDKKLLLHTEQGFGDSIMFAKFIELLKNKYKCKIILQCRDQLKSLFENSFKDIDYFYARDTENIPDFDYQYPMLSLPFLLGIKSVDEFPTSNPYLFPKTEKDLNITKNKGTIDIGICWSASVTGDSYDGKVFDIEYFRPLIEHKKFNIYSLQVGPEKEDLVKANLDKQVINLTDKLTDFNKTAYLMNQLDLVISSDTSVAHLAGAIGKEVWIPLQKYPDWRWENKGDTSYWYQSAKLFRQKTARKWDSVFQSIYDKINRTYKVRLKLK